MPLLKTFILTRDIFYFFAASINPAGKWSAVIDVKKVGEEHPTIQRESDNGKSKKNKNQEKIL